MPGTYRCVCIEGYEGTGDKDGGDCVNIDECAKGMHDCHLNSQVRLVLDFSNLIGLTSFLKIGCGLCATGIFE